MSSSERTSRWTAEQRDRERELFAEFARLRATTDLRGRDDVPGERSELRAVRDELVTMHLGLVHHLAQRYGARGSSGDDVVQVGIVGLINAVDRFDLDRGHEFSTFETADVRLVPQLCPSFFYRKPVSATHLVCMYERMEE
jgi:DNA-directed RNA polymerase sigma subunit (sigma70/sigma32)